MAVFFDSVVVVLTVLHVGTAQIWVTGQHGFATGKAWMDTIVNRFFSNSAKNEIHTEPENADPCFHENPGQADAAVKGAGGSTRSLAVLYFKINRVEKSTF